jgi:hypothetical protein
MSPIGSQIPQLNRANGSPAGKKLLGRSQPDNLAAFPSDFRPVGKILKNQAASLQKKNDRAGFKKNKGSGERLSGVCLFKANFILKNL